MVVSSLLHLLLLLVSISQDPGLSFGVFIEMVSFSVVPFFYISYLTLSFLHLSFFTLTSACFHKKKKRFCFKHFYSYLSSTEMSLNISVTPQTNNSFIHVQIKAILQKVYFPSFNVLNVRFPLPSNSIYLSPYIWGVLHSRDFSTCLRWAFLVLTKW